MHDAIHQMHGETYLQQLKAVNVETDKDRQHSQSKTHFCNTTHLILMQYRIYMTALCLTSGAAQAKVPMQYSVDRNCCCMILAKPTSAILAVKSLDNRMLADLRSKCTIFLECRKCRPRAVSRAIRRPSPGLLAPVAGSLHQVNSQ